MDFDLIKYLLTIAAISSMLSTLFIQKVKSSCVSIESFNKSCLVNVGFVVSMLVGFLFSLSFGGVSIINSVWVGFFTFVGADSIYQIFEDKIFSTFGELKDHNTDTIDYVRDE